MFKMPVARLADLVSATIAHAAPLAGLDPDHRSPPRRWRHAPARRRYEELMTDDEATRAHDIGEMFAVLPSIDVHPAVSAAYRDAPAAPVGAYRSDSVEPMTPSEVDRLVAEALGDEPRPVARRRVRRPPVRRMRVLVSGAAGFIGRWVVADLLERGHTVLPVDNLVAGDPANLAEFEGHPRMRPLEVGDVRDAAACRRWAGEVDAIAHLAASISVQDSIDDPATTFDNDVVGTFNLLEAARPAGTRFLFMSTCMVYDRATTAAGIDEDHPTKPASPYAASKLAGEALTLSYHHAYGLPTTVVRPFNTYGPFQRSVGEGGVVAIFTRRSLAGEPLRIYGDGTQTRDLLYVTDCARFVVDALFSDAVVGQVAQRGDRGRCLGQRAGRGDRAGPGAHRPCRAHPPAERDRGPALRPARARELLGWTPGGRPRRGPRAGARLDGRADGARARARLMACRAGPARDRRRRTGPLDACCRTPTR